MAQVAKDYDGLAQRLVDRGQIFSDLALPPGVCRVTQVLAGLI